ncbi:MAG: EF-P lysine aminoacylase GenX [Polyangiaceae bacterium]|nr:EF-P lysine aminoacylase GenX [Polyangiaceae bacterium]
MASRTRADVPRPIHAPSDVVAPGGPRGRVRVGGRVAAGRGQELALADALGRLPLGTPVDGPSAAARRGASHVPGELVVVEADVAVAAAGASARTAIALEGWRVVERPGGRARPGGEAHRLGAGGLGSALALRAELVRATRAFLEARGFLEVETPLVVPSPGLDVHLDAFELARSPGDAARPAAFLSTSPEYQMKRLLAGGLPRIFQLGRAFRRDEQGRWHNPEFTMLEWYRAFATVEEVMTDTEELVRALGTHGARGGDRAAVRVGEREIRLDRPFARLGVAEAFARFAGVGRAEVLELAARDEERYFRLLVERVEPGLAAFDVPVFLCDYPASQASLARRKPDDPELCERFELYLAGVELCNGFGELTDATEQRARLERDQAERLRSGKPAYPIDERFLAALEEGMPPAAGNALGLDRLVALVAGAAGIDAVMAFPADVL